MCAKNPLHNPPRMFGGFSHGSGHQEFFERRRGGAALLLLLLVGFSAVYFVLYPLLLRGEDEDTMDVELEPEIQDITVEEEPEEPEPEEEPPPPPPKNVKVKVVKNPKPKPKVQTPVEMEEGADETDQEKVVEVAEGGKPGGMGVSKPKKPAEPKPGPKKPVPEPAKKKPAGPQIDPTKPVDRPEGATNPIPDPGNAMPEYPKALRDKGITGYVHIKLHIHRDGKVKGAKILKVDTTATTEEEKKQAEKLLKLAVVKAIKTWTFTPSKLKGTPISIWKTMKFPFQLKM